MHGGHPDYSGIPIWLIFPTSSISPGRWRSDGRILDKERPLGMYYTGISSAYCVKLDIYTVIGGFRAELGSWLMTLDGQQHCELYLRVDDNTVQHIMQIMTKALHSRSGTKHSTSAQLKSGGTVNRNDP